MEIIDVKGTEQQAGAFEAGAQVLPIAAYAALRQYGIVVRVITAVGGGDARIELYAEHAKEKQPIIYHLERKTALRPATLGAVVARLQGIAQAEGQPVLLLADHITPPVAEKLREMKQQFVDNAGNAYLFGPGLYVYVVGRKPTDLAVKTTEAHALTATGIKIQFALLCDLTLVEQPLREIATTAGVALGAVPPVMETLQKAGQIIVNGKHRRLHPTKQVLDRWAYDYAKKLRPKTLVARYSTENFANWKDWAIDPAVAQWGAEPAANLLTDHLTPGILTLYAERMPPRLLVEQRMQKTEDTNPNGTIELRKPYWGTLRERVTNAEGADRTVWPILVYADLLATGEARNIETAGILYERYLAGLFPAA
jgi:hypothetical protein